MFDSAGGNLSTDPENTFTTGDETVASAGDRTAVRHADACLVVIRGDSLGARVGLDSAELRIGRNASADLRLPHRNVSRAHCAITRHGDIYWLRDLYSTNGTYLNEQPIERAPLRDGDQIRIGQTVLKFIAAGNIEADYHNSLRESAMRDGLTGLFNRNHALAAIDELLADDTELALAIIDIDYFKAINDDHGHLVGDGVLREISALMRQQIDPAGLAARLGGEEFVLVFPNHDIATARPYCEALREAIDSHRFEDDQTSSLHVTVSIGLAQSTADASDASDLLRRADEALYRAKNTGRNRTC